MKCFILDDERPFCHQLREMLSKALATADIHIETTFSSAVTYLRTAYLKDTLPDLLFCDFRLQGSETGLDLLQLLANEQIAVPAILLTDLDDPHVIQQAKQLGVPHITKTGLNSTDLVRELSLFAFQSWAEQRRNLERELRRQSENMLLLAAEIAHEFKSVMTATQTQVRRINRLHRLNALTSDGLDKIQKQLQQKMEDGSELTNVLFTYGTLKGRQAKFEDVELNSALREIVRRDDSSRDLAITVSAETGVGAKIDLFLFGRIVAILLKNVVDHCPDRTHVSFAAGEMEHEGVRSVFVDVEDDGPGIPLEMREKIFDPGERAGKEIRYHAGAGLGLGLAFARVLATLHGGPLMSAVIRCIEPVQLGGASFRIIIPQE